MNCENKTCSDNEFSCGGRYNVCILYDRVCDGIRDCSDGRDEANCTTTSPTQREVCIFRQTYLTQSLSAYLTEDLSK